MHRVHWGDEAQEAEAGSMGGRGWEEGGVACAVIFSHKLLIPEQPKLEKKDDLVVLLC